MGKNIVVLGQITAIIYGGVIGYLNITWYFIILGGLINVCTNFIYDPKVYDSLAKKHGLKGKAVNIIIHIIIATSLPAISYIILNLISYI